MHEDDKCAVSSGCRRHVVVVVVIVVVYAVVAPAITCPKVTLEDLEL